MQASGPALAPQRLRCRRGPGRGNKDEPGRERRPGRAPLSPRGLLDRVRWMSAGSRAAASARAPSALMRLPPRARRGGEGRGRRGARQRWSALGADEIATWGGGGGVGRVMRPRQRPPPFVADVAVVQVEVSEFGKKGRGRKRSGPRPCDPVGAQVEAREV